MRLAKVPVKIQTAKDLESELEKELAKDLVQPVHQDYSRHRILLLKRLQAL
jgi:hypothetical protein